MERLLFVRQDVRSGRIDERETGPRPPAFMRRESRRTSLPDSSKLGAA
jgi:hypothetical protein